MATKYTIHSKDGAEYNLTAQLVKSGKVLVKTLDGFTARRIAADTLAKRNGDVLATLEEFYTKGDNGNYYSSVTEA